MTRKKIIPITALILLISITIGILGAMYQNTVVLEKVSRNVNTHENSRYSEQSIDPGFCIADNKEKGINYDYQNGLVKETPSMDDYHAGIVRVH